MWSVLLAVYICFIFSNSMTPAVDSSRNSGKVLAAVRQVMALSGLEPEAISEFMVRKTAHVVEYMGLGVLSVICLGCYGIGVGMRALVTAFLCLAVPFVDETIQLFSAGRSGQLGDVWLDLAGAASGGLFCLAARRLRKNRRKRE